LVIGLATPSDSDTSSIDSDGDGDSDSDSDNDTPSEYSSDSSGSDEPAFAMRQVPTTRRIKGNTSEEGALMINGPLGKNTWKHVQVVEIKNNVAKADSMMFNHHMDERGMDLAERAMALARKQQEWRQAQQKGQR
jgi:hypothetical protein